jgi:asparagine synthase (glutamine-hydrolysing)
MTKILLTARTGQLVQLEPDFWLIGTVYQGAVRVAPSVLREQLLAHHSIEAIADRIKDWGGFFAVVFCAPDGRVVAITDRGRTHPLLCAIHDDAAILSNTPAALFAQLPGAKVDPLAAEEYANAGFVSGEGTLIEGVRQLGPGTILEIHPDGGCRSLCYRDFVPVGELRPSSDATSRRSQLAQALRDSVARLIDYANGRTLILPLSGGVDSRALLAMLIESGYPQLKAFTFGRPRSRDFRVGQQLAQACGVPVKAVPYRRGRWQAVWRSKRFAEYLAHAHGLVSVPNLQAIPALFELTDSGWVEPDSVFVPALAGFFPGGCLPSATELARPEGIRAAIMAKHFRTGDLARISPALKARFAARLEALATAHPARTAGGAGPEAAARALLLSEAFEYHERQAKFIGNACRYFDSQGYDWWLPLWDAEFLSACEALPLAARRDKRLLKALTHELERRYPGLRGAPPPFVVNGGFLRDPRLRAMTGYFLEPFGQFAVVPFGEWFARVYLRAPAGGTVIDTLARRCLRAIEAELAAPAP